MLSTTNTFITTVHTFICQDTIKLPYTTNVTNWYVIKHRKTTFQAMFNVTMLIVNSVFWLIHIMMKLNVVDVLQVGILRTLVVLGVASIVLEE
jgi:hypothetical protein